MRCLCSISWHSHRMIRHRFWRVIALVLSISPIVAMTSFQCARANIPAASNTAGIQVHGKSEVSARAESELQQGIALTQQGHFSEAIPHFMVAQGHVSDEYAVNFNLALCYVGTGQFNQAIQVLSALRINGHATPGVNNLLAQAYMGTSQDKEAFSAFQQAVKQTPADEKLYLFVADACMDHESYDMGLEVLNIGLQHLPRSSRLHYERGVFLTFKNEPDPATADFDLAGELSPGSDIFYLAAGQKALLEGNMPEAVRITRKAIEKGHDNYILLTIFGKAVMRSGVRPDQLEFSEAQRALEKSVAERPNYVVSQAALGELYLMAGRPDAAITHMEMARRLAPDNPSVYSHLAIAYRRKGDTQKAERMLAILAALNQKQAAKYKSDSPGHKAGYVSSGRPPRQPSSDPYK